MELQPAQSHQHSQRRRPGARLDDVDGHGRGPPGAADRQRRRHVRHHAVQPSARDRRQDAATCSGAIGTKCRPTSAWGTRRIAASRSTATTSTRRRRTARVVALDAKTGKVVWNKAVENYNNGYYMTIAPLAARGRIMVGVSGGERGIRGFVVALDAEHRRAGLEDLHGPRARRARQRHLAGRLVAHRRRARLGDRAASIPSSV